tara:strand:+ start:393 stop:824 length:432 start_codon:yes stop_codon:yes gene_type:complete
MTNIKLSQKIKNNIYRHARKLYPKECCGFLIGYIINNTLICEEIKICKNIADDPYNYFEIDPKDIIYIYKKYRNTKLSIIGHYHSHPKDLLNSLPSQKDIDSIYDSNLCWLILGINNAQVEYSAYVPKFIKENTYNFKRINII